MNKIHGLFIILLFVIRTYLNTATLGYCQTIEANTSEDDYSKYVPIGDVLPEVTAKSAIVIEASAGKILYGRNIDTMHYLASTTKAMTLLVALEYGNPTDIVAVSNKAANMEGSTVWLEYDEKVKLQDLLYGMMLVSGNDAAEAIAEHISGNSSRFAELMTKKAHEIGAEHTNFCNPSGLPNPMHYTTARDMAMITAYGYNNPEFAKIVSTKEYMMKREHDPVLRKVENENILLWIYSGGNGVKTGYTDDAGRCLISAAKRNGIQLISIVFDSVYMWNDSIAMLNYGFQNVRPNVILSAHHPLTSILVSEGTKSQIKLCTSNEIIVPDFGNGTDDYTISYNIPSHLAADVQAGDIVGQADILYNGKQVGTTDVIAAETVERKSLFQLLYKFYNAIMNGE